MMAKEKKEFTTVKHGKVTIEVSGLFQDDEGVEVIVLEDVDNIIKKSEVDQTSTIQIILQVSDEAYPHIKYIFEHMEDVEILEDRYVETKELNVSNENNESK